MKHKLTYLAIGKAARALALAINGGDWDIDYTKAQKLVWIERVKRAMS
jgi:hypothetical protein